MVKYILLLIYFVAETNIQTIKKRTGSGKLEVELLQIADNACVTQYFPTNADRNSSEGSTKRLKRLAAIVGGWWKHQSEMLLNESRHRTNRRVGQCRRVKQKLPTQCRVAQQQWLLINQAPTKVTIVLRVPYKRS